MKTTKHDFTSGLYPTGRYGDNVMCDYTYTASAWGQMGGGVCDCMCVQVDVCVCADQRVWPAFTLMTYSISLYTINTGR